MVFSRRRYTNPRRRLYRRRRKVYKRRYSNRRAIARRVPITTMFPFQRVVKLVYDDVWYLNSAAAIYAINTFRLNSIFDPDSTGVGGVPSGGSIWGGMFTYYKVLGCKVQTKWVANCNQCLLVGFHAYANTNNNYSTPASATAVQQVLTELPNTCHAVVGPANVSAANATCRLTRYFPIKSIIGSESYRSDNAFAEVGANPATLAMCDLMLTDSLTATANNVAFVNVRLTFYVRFSEPDATYTD